MSATSSSNDEDRSAALVTDAHPDSPRWESSDEEDEDVSFRRRKRRDVDDDGDDKASDFKDDSPDVDDAASGSHDADSDHGADDRDDEVSLPSVDVVPPLAPPDAEARYRARLKQLKDQAIDAMTSNPSDFARLRAEYQQFKSLHDSLDSPPVVPPAPADPSAQVQKKKVKIDRDLPRMSVDTAEKLTARRLQDHLD